jgi:hypothetical protein
MLNKLLIILAVSTLAGCATTEPVVKIVTQRVEVPIAVPCKTDIPAVPDFNFEKLTTDSDIYQKTQSLLADQNLHKGYEGQLLSALKSCK